MRKSVIPVLGVLFVGVLLAGCPPPGTDCPDCTRAHDPGEPFACPANTADLIPVDEIPVTVRAGRLAAGPGHVKVPARAGSGAPEIFDTNNQVRHQAPDLSLTANEEWVILHVEGHPGGGSQVCPPNSPLCQDVKLKRCTDHEGNLVRIHVDAPEKGTPDPGPPSITVTGIYDRLTSDSALADQAYSCKRCGRVEVCGVPDCP